MKNRLTISAILSALLMTFSLVIAASAFAGPGAKEGGGGDVCQNRIEDIRNDISNWIQQGGSAKLDFAKSGTTQAEYDTKMQIVIDQTRLNDQTSISCTDNRALVEVGEAQKTCVAIPDSTHPQILCYRGETKNGQFVSGFMGLSANDQYFQVHHELAVLAGIEDQPGQLTDYPLSQQISGWLQQQLVKKLAIMPAQSALSGSRKFIVTLQGGEITPIQDSQVCDKVFIQACDQAEAECRALGDPSLECDYGCETTYSSGPSYGGGQDYCTVTATLNAQIVPWVNVNATPRLATASFSSTEECQNASATIQGIAPDTQEFSLQSDCNANTLEVRITPSKSRERTPPDGSSSGKLYAQSKYYGSKALCLEARKLLFNLQSSNFSITGAGNNATEDCDFNNGGFFHRQYQFDFEIHINNMYEN